ncbi:hypothetical protein Trydic_g14743 [Trypoxylus dichotomus]
MRLFLVTPHTLTLKGTIQVFSSYYCPFNEVDPRYSDIFALIVLGTNSRMLNITEKSKKLHHDDKIITIFVGFHETPEVWDYLRKFVPENLTSFKSNNDEWRLEIESEYQIDFNRKRIVARLPCYS